MSDVNKTQLTVETLEVRLAPASVAFFDGYDFKAKQVVTESTAITRVAVEGKALVIQCTDQDEKVQVAPVMWGGRQYTRIRITFNEKFPGGVTTTRKEDFHMRYDWGMLDPLSMIVFYGQNGDNSFSYTPTPGRTPCNVLAVGGTGKDGLSGGPRADILISGGGDGNWLSGLGDGDILIGGDGVDILRGGPGCDILLGGDGVDDLGGEGGIDILDGGQLRGQGVQDGLSDTLNGGPERDYFVPDPMHRTSRWTAMPGLQNADTPKDEAKTQQLRDGHTTTNLTYPVMLALAQPSASVQQVFLDYFAPPTGDPRAARTDTWDHWARYLAEVSLKFSGPHFDRVFRGAR